MENQNQDNQLPSKTTKRNTEDYLTTNPIINAQSFKKIREIPNPEEPIGKTILRICHMIGVVGELLPDTIQVCEWIEGIRKYYSGYAPEELYLACEMNHYGKLSPKVIHYGKFSIDYLSECLKLYEEKKQAEILREKSKIQPVQPSGQKALGYHVGRAYWIELEKWLKNEKTVPLYWDWGKVFQFLLDDGRLTDFPKEVMVEIYNKFKIKGTSQAMSGRISASMSPNDINGNQPTTIGKIAEFDNLTGDNSVKHECRKYVVQQYLTVLGLAKLGTLKTKRSNYY